VGDASGERIERLTGWLATQLPGATDVRIEAFEGVPMGHSAETARLTVAWSEAGDVHRRDAVLRVRPPSPGLLEPYDLRRQFDVLRALEATPVHAPRVLWYEGTGDVLGREFYVMEFAAGTVYERTLPPDLEADGARLGRMSRSLTDELAAIHSVDLAAAGLTFLGDAFPDAGRDHVGRELDHWEAEMRRVQRAPLPALELLLAELRRCRPEDGTAVTLVHGDAKPGNFAFVDDRVNAVFDWEMTSVGDPLTDIGWAEVNWTTPGSFTNRPGSLTRDEFVARWGERTGIPTRHREWYRALAGYKMCVIMLVASMLFDAGHTDDVRFGQMGLAVHPYTVPALAELGIDDAPEPGPVTPRPERLERADGRQDG
jgi:aminoglycoside phosphotransferase (APT) family kinase protein